jgi:hypothetical protein
VCWAGEGLQLLYGRGGQCGTRAVEAQSLSRRGGFGQHHEGLRVTVPQQRVVYP